jgi:hypothetical protein
MISVSQSQSIPFNHNRNFEETGKNKIKHEQDTYTRDPDIQGTDPTFYLQLSS